MLNTLQFCWHNTVYIHMTPLRSSPVSGIMHYPRESGSALETFDVALKMSPIPDQKKCRYSQQRSVTATSVAVRAYRTNLVMWQEVQGTWGGELGHVSLFPKLSEMYLLLFADIIWRTQRSSAHAVWELCHIPGKHTHHPEKGDCAGCGKPW